MIKIGAIKNRYREITDKIMEAKIGRIRMELSQVDFCITDENCIVEINPNICVKNNFIALQIRARPCVGLYKDIDFVVTMFIQDNDSVKPPQLYNDRRVFHPNIDPYTLQIAIPQLINWSPVHPLVYILRRLKYTLVQPNNATIPNNHICRKAAYFYKIDRQNYRNYIIQYCPAVLENIVGREGERGREGTEGREGKMEDQGDRARLRKYVAIGDILPVTRLDRDRGKWAEEDEGFEFLNKRLSMMKIDANQDKDNERSGSGSGEKQNQTIFSNCKEEIMQQD